MSQLATLKATVCSSTASDGFPSSFGSSQIATVPGVPSGEAETFAARVAAMNLPGELLSAVAPLLATFDLLNSQIAFSDEAIAVATEDDEVVQNLQTVPGIGPVTAAAFRALVEPGVAELLAADLWRRADARVLGEGPLAR